MARIAIFGAGYVGLVTGACLADTGHDVVVRDVVVDRIEALEAGRVPIYEPGLDEVIARSADRLRFTLDMGEALEDADFAFIAVGTPPTHSGDADLSAVWTVVDELPAGTELTLVMKSTVPPGTGEKVRRALETRGLDGVGYVSNPEFLAEGTAVRDFMQPDRVVVGAFEPERGEAVAALYDSLDATIVHTDVASAEMIKLASNAFLSTKISFINEIASVCELVGADVVDVAHGIGLDSRLGPHFLRAGLGFGGSCFPKDVSALKQLAGNSGYHFQLLAAVIEVNELQKRRVIQKLKRHLGDLHGKRITLLGMAFKPGTDDLREAPSLVIAARLLAEGADVHAWDPVADARSLLPDVTFHADATEAMHGADAAVIVTEWPQLKTVSWDAVREVMRTPVLVDGRNLLDAGAMRRLGFAFEGIGRPSAAAGDAVREDPTPVSAEREA